MPLHPSGFGLKHPRDVRVADVLSISHPEASAPVPMPDGSPGRISLAQLGVTDPGAGHPLPLHVIGDDGGIVTEVDQAAVMSSIIADLGGPFPALFQQHVGDRVYYNGDPAQFVPQFYEPRQQLHCPVLGPAGNHDWDNSDGVSGSGTASWMANFCTPGGAVPPPCDQDLEYGRKTTPLPFCDYTLTTEAAWFTNVCSNVPSGGHLYQPQLDFLAAEGKAVPAGVLWIVTAHHPCFSVDALNGGSAEMLSWLDSCWTAAGREPDAVWAGHIHDTQFFERTMPSRKVIPYVVTGNGGYRNLHPLASDYSPGMTVSDGLVCAYADASEWGYLRVTIQGGKIGYEYVGVAADGTVTPAKFTL